MPSHALGLDTTREHPIESIAVLRMKQDTIRYDANTTASTLVPIIWVSGSKS
jgi:hypothetical protein